MINKYVLLLTSLLLISCGRDGTFYPDPIDPRIIKYTEDGVDAAGAMINGRLWKSVVSLGLVGPGYNLPTSQYYPQNDSLVISFSGEMADTGEGVNFYFGMSGLRFDKTGMTGLKGKKITLDGSKNAAYIYSLNTSCNTSYNPGIGQLYIREISHSFSGTFSFTVSNDNCEPIIINYGRFDYLSLN